MIAAWRNRSGVATDAAAFVAAYVDAARVLSGIGRWEASCPVICDDCRAVGVTTDDHVVMAALAAPMGDDIFSDVHVSRLLGLSAHEHSQIEQASGRAVAIPPDGETAADRQLRRARRKRETARLRLQRYRARKTKERKVTFYETLTTYTYSVSDFVTLRGPMKIMAALAAGEATPSQIIAQTGLKASTVKMALKRLAARGEIHKVARGKYRRSE